MKCPCPWWSRMWLFHRNWCRHRTRCFVREIDGMPVVVLGDPAMSDESRAALDELVRAAMERAKRMDWEVGPTTDDRVREIRRKADL